MIEQWNRRVRECRAAAFGYKWAWLVTAEMKNYELNEWLTEKLCEKWEEPYSKSGRFLDGVLPQRHLRKYLMSEFPILKSCLINPIWWSLSRLSKDPGNRCFWNSCAASIAVSGVPLYELKPSAMNLFGGNYSWWDSFGFLILIMRTDSAEFSEHRTWLESNFFPYMCIVLSTYPAKWIVPHLFFLIDGLESNGYFNGVQLDYWPGSLKELNQELEMYGCIFKSVVAQKWWWKNKNCCNPWLLVWLLLEDLTVVQALFDSEDRNYKLPAAIQARWQRTVLACNRCCPILQLDKVSMSGLSRYDKRILNRLTLELEWM